MTDGIIQKVIGKYIQSHDCECPDADTNQWNELIRTEFIMIQQELVEEIKKIPVSHNYNYYSIIRHLIGDNE